MSIQLLPKPSEVQDFTPLAEHEAQTPSTFFGARPVLHALNTSSAVLASRKILTDDRAPAFQTLATLTLAAAPPSPTDATAPFGDMIAASGCCVFATSESLILSFATPQAPFAISIPYPSISLHAIQRLYAGGASPPARFSTTPTPANPSSLQAIYLQIDPSYATRHQSNPDFDNDDDDDVDETLELLLVPDVAGNAQEDAQDARAYYAGGRTEEAQKASAKALFEALSRCADLHPDPAEEGDDEGEGGGVSGLGVGGMPGAGGWITAENMHEFEGMFGDAAEEEEGEGEGEDGERGEALGPGAGTRRARDNGDGDDEAVGENGVEDETKWQRTA